ncbi:MAG: ribbon-helix-helix domain-containing protein [Candidatus Heimdallarchaeota archaeon]
MAKVSISITVDEATLAIIDDFIARGVLKSRSEAVRGGIGAFVREKMGITTRAELRAKTKTSLKADLLSPEEAIRSVREEEN